jgi:excisionase family DNA binding protein
MSTEADGTLSITAAAGQLGVTRSTVWRMIADGDLDAETTLRGRRTVTRVRLPEPFTDPSQPPRSRTARLQDQVDALSQTVERLSAMLTESERESTRMQAALHRRPERPAMPSHIPPPDSAAIRARRTAVRRAPVVRTANAIEEAEAVVAEAITGNSVDRLPQGITARPNPMTHPATQFRPACVTNRDDALAPVRELFKSRRRDWWQRLPLVARD